MAGANAAIDHRHANTVAGVARVDHARRLRGVKDPILLRQLNRMPVRRNVRNIGILFQLRQHAGRNAVYAAVDEIEAGSVLGAECCPLLTMLAQRRSCPGLNNHVDEFAGRRLLASQGFEPCPFFLQLRREFPSAPERRASGGQQEGQNEGADLDMFFNRSHFSRLD
jgi:hypothetical protein